MFGNQLVESYLSLSVCVSVKRVYLLCVRDRESDLLLFHVSVKRLIGCVSVSLSLTLVSVGRHLLLPLDILTRSVINTHANNSGSASGQGLCDPNATIASPSQCLCSVCARASQIFLSLFTIVIFAFSTHMYSPVSVAPTVLALKPAATLPASTLPLAHATPLPLTALALALRSILVLIAAVRSLPAAVLESARVVAIPPGLLPGVPNVLASLGLVALNAPVSKPTVARAVVLANATHLQRTRALATLATAVLIALARRVCATMAVPTACAIRMAPTTMPASSASVTPDLEAVHATAVIALLACITAASATAHARVIGVAIVSLHGTVITATAMKKSLGLFSNIY